MTEKLDKLLHVFYEHSSVQFTVRELAALSHLPKSTVQQYLFTLKKNKFVLKSNQANLISLFKIKKKHYYVEKLVQSGLIAHLEKVFSPSCIILFGSIAKGESEKESDIDLFIETTKKTRENLIEFEKKLGHEIQVFQEQKITDLPDRLLNNVVNGIKLMGFFKIK